MLNDKRKKKKEDYVKGILSGIDSVSDEEMEQIEMDRAEDKKKSRDSMFSENVPTRYKNVKFDGDPKLLETQRSVIYGPYGTGKTYLGYAIARELFVSGKIEKYTIVRERELYNVILEGNMKEIREKYFSAGLLIIDEYGKNSITDSSSSQIFNIIDYRYDWELRTILICNAIDGKELKKIVPEAIQDRFIGSTHKMEGESRRKAE